MLKIQKDSPNTESKKRTPNLLPCHIHHDGPANASSRYWEPEVTQDGRLEAYFRGRKLKGKEVKLPEGYEGVVVEDAGIEQRSLNRDGLVEDPEGNEEVGEMKLLKETGSFENIVLWGHGGHIEDDDAFAKGLNEWIGFADAIHKPGNDKEVAS